MKDLSDLWAKVYINSIIKLLRVAQGRRGIRSRLARGLIATCIRLGLKMPWQNTEPRSFEYPALH